MHSKLTQRYAPTKGLASDIDTTNKNLSPQRQRRWEQRRKERLLERVGNEASSWDGYEQLLTIVIGCAQCNAAFFMRGCWLVNA